MDRARISQSHRTPVALFDLTPEQLADENLDATVEVIMAALASTRALRAAQTRPAHPSPS